MSSTNFNAASTAANAVASTAVNAASLAAKIASARASDAAIGASVQASNAAKGANFGIGTLIFAIIVSIFFIVFASLSINEGLKTAEQDTETNMPLASMSVVTMVVSFVLIVLVPLLCVSRYNEDSAAMYTYGAPYTILVGALFISVMSILSLLAAYDKPNSVNTNTGLKILGGISVGASVLIFGFCTFAVVGMYRTR